MKISPIKIEKLKEQPRLSIIILSKNNLEYLIQCLDSIKDNVNYTNFEIIIGDTGSFRTVIDELNEYISTSYLDISVVEYDYYSFSRINNDIVLNHIDENTELVLFCNDDIKLLNDSISGVVQTYLKYKKIVGTIGIKLLYEDETIQHNGIKINVDNKNQLYIFHDKKNNRIMLNLNSIGNTGAFLLIRKELFIEIGMFNENYSECFEDVELNLKLLLIGKKNITDYKCVANHYESVTRKKSPLFNENVINDYKNNVHPFYLKNEAHLKKYFNQI